MAQYVAVRKYGFWHLPLCEVQVYAEDEQSPLEKNVAQGKPTWQDSTYLSGASGRAVDGNTNPTYDAGFCSHTNGGTHKWWMVDLERDTRVSRVRLYNRLDSCCSKYASRSKMKHMVTSDRPGPAETYSKGHIESLGITAVAMLAVLR